MFSALLGQISFQGPGINVQTPGVWTPGQILAASIPVLAFLLIAFIITLAFKHKKNRMHHEQQMLALQQGLLSPKMADQRDSSRARVRAWIWVGFGVPIGCVAAATVTTIAVLDHSRVLEGIIYAVWIVGAVIATAAVIMAGIGLMVEQRFHWSQAESAPQPAADKRPRVFNDSPQGMEEAFRKQESP